MSYNEVAAHKPYTVTKNCFQLLDNHQVEDSPEVVPSNYKRMWNQKQQYARNNINDHHGRTTMQHPTDRQIPRCEPKDQNNSERELNLTSRNNPTNPQMSASTNISVSDKVIHEEHKTPQHIPTIVNGEVIETISSKVELPNPSNKVSKRNLMSNLITELANKRNSFSSNKKHKIICIGDNHVRGFANMIKNLVSNNFEFYSVLKPGSSSNQLLETASQEIMKLNLDDILIICSGTNDLATNRTTLAFQNISNMVTKNNHTNIILENIPYRYDTADTNTVKDSIEKFNRRLEKLVKVSPHASFPKTEQNRKLYTRHGLRYNRLGKRYLLHQIALMVYSLLEQKITCPIRVGWNKPDASEDKPPNRTTTCSRKLPVTRSTDFLW